MFKKYICIKQYDISDCGAACLSTIAKQYGSKVPITKIREIAGTDKQGTSVYGIIQAAEAIGFSAKGVKANHESFFSEFPLPAIAHVVTNSSLLHYVVIHLINKNKVIIADPAKGIVEYTTDEFFKIWTGALILMVPSNQFKRGNETTNMYKKFFCILKSQKSLLLHIFLASIIHTILGILGAFYFKFLIDDILQYNLKRMLNALSIAVITINIFKITLQAFRSHLLLYLSQKIDIPLILGYYEHVIDLPMGFFSNRRVGEIISRFMDASKIREAISNVTLTVMVDTLMAIAGGMILYYQNPYLFGIAVIILVFYCMVVFIFNKPIRESNRKNMESNAELMSYLVESLNGIETIKSFNAERVSKFETEKKFIKFLKNIFFTGKIHNLQHSLTTLISSIGTTLILWAGAYSVINGNMSVGQLLVFNSLLVYFIEPVKNLINLQPLIQTAVVASQRLGEILDLEKEKTEFERKKISPTTLNGSIELKNINFRYGTRELILKNISMLIKQGEKIALVGSSGSGKTTLTKLLLNLYSPESGEILINGINIQDINIETLRERIAYVPQETFLFSGSIYDNITLGVVDTELEEVINASKLSQAHDFINTLPLRYNTYLEENGSNLSGGQRQRLAITRAILKKPDILILDEATSNLDSITEKSIERTLNNLSSNTTTIIIAHRLSTIMQCDKIYVINNGEIIEFGSHHELMQLDGFYCNLWREQIPEHYKISKKIAESVQEGV